MTNHFVPSKRVLGLLIGYAFVGIALASCGGGDGEEAEAAPASVGTPNNAPTISGAPLTVVLQNTLYSFTPAAVDGDGDILTFSVAGLPPWATFNTATGRLQGTPTQAQVGTYTNITVSVTDGAATVSLATFQIQVTGTATGMATLSWIPPTANTDGSPLSDLAGYKIYWGTAQGVYPNSVEVSNPGLSSYSVDQLTPATWYFVVTAVNGQGSESQFSNEASKAVL